MFNKIAFDKSNEKTSQNLILIMSVTGVLAATLFITTGIGAAVSALGSFGKTPEQVAPAPFPRLAAALQAELNTALSPEMPFNFEGVGNPFADKTGVSLAKNSPAAPGSNPGSSPSLPAVFPRQSPVAVQPYAQNYPGGAPLPLPVPTPLVPVAVATKDLILERNRQIKLGNNVAELPTFYSIDEIKPFGYVGSGDSKVKVKIYSPATGMRFRVPRGTRFRDGTIESLNNQGVSFRRDNGQVVFIRWAKNIKDAGDSPNAPILRQPDDGAASPVPQITVNRP